MRRFLLSIILIFSIYPIVYAACFCTHPAISEAFAQAESVVIAKIIQDDPHNGKAKFKILKNFKGKNETEISLSNGETENSQNETNWGSHEDNCEEFYPKVDCNVVEINSVHLLFIRSTDSSGNNKIHTSSCDGSKNIKLPSEISAKIETYQELFDYMTQSKQGNILKELEKLGEDR